MKQAMYTGSSEQKKAYGKLMHGLWATNKKISYRSNKIDSRCQRCSYLHENWNHIFQCTETTNNTKQQSLQKILRTFLQKSKVSRPMIIAIMTGIEQWTTKQPFHTLFPTSPTNDHILTKVNEAYDQQTIIGWENFLRGRLAKQWFQAHDIYFQQRHLRENYKSQNLGPRLVRELWNYCLQTWAHRNQNRFGATPKEQSQRNNMRLDNEITHAYHHRENLTENDIKIIYKLSLEIIKSKPITFKKNWLYMYNVSITLHDTSTENVTPASTPRNYFQIFTRPFQPNSNPS